jgi:hypothetical protein
MGLDFDIQFTDLRAGCACLEVGSLIDTAEKKKFPRQASTPTSFLHPPLYPPPYTLKMVKRKLGALEKVEADL